MTSIKDSLQILSAATDDLSGTLNVVHIETLKNAVELSPFSKDRTLGPDMNISWDEKGDIIEESHTKIVLNSTQNNRSATEIDKKSPKARNIQLIDYKSVGNNMIYKMFESDRKAIVLKNVSLKTEVMQHEDDKRRKHYENCKRDQENYIRKKIEIDSKLIYESEKYAEQTLQRENKELENMRKHTEHILQNIYLDAVAKYESQFRLQYAKITKLLINTDNEKLVSFQQLSATLKSCVEMFDILIENIKSEQIGANEVKTAQRLCEDINGLEINLFDEIEQIENSKTAKHQEEVRQLELQQKLAIEAIEKQKEEQLKLESKTTVQAAEIQVEAATVPVVPITPVLETIDGKKDVNRNSGYNQFVSEERLQFYNNILAFYTEKVERVKPLQNDVNMKKYRFACNKAINIPVNAISAVTPQHLQDKFDKLFHFLSGSPVSTAEGQLSINDHPLGRDYCLLLMSKKFVSQGDTAVSSNPQAAFAIAKIIVSLWNHITDFGKLFLAYLFKESPFLVPYFIPQHREQSREEYLKKLGYRMTDGVLEQQDMYLKRQSGMARLYFAVMVTNGRKADGPKHPYGLENAWIWLTNILILEPLPDICAAFLLEFLQLAGSTLWMTYRKQFTKVLQVIQMEYFPKLSKVDEGGPKARLDAMLANIIKDGTIPDPVGQIDRNFW